NIKGKAIAILGSSGSGKSTLSAGLWKKGYKIYADDVGALTYNNSIFSVHKGITRLKISKETALELGIDINLMDPVFEDHFEGKYDKFYLKNNESEKDQPETLPLD